MHAVMSMLSGRGRGLTGFVVGVLATLTVVGGGVAIAAIPSTTTAKFNGCVSKDTGVLRVINYEAGKRCKRSEKGISWAQGWTYKGIWRATTSYRPGDVVLDNGSSYVARAASVAKPPVTDASRWGLLASPGPQGATGPAGPVGVAYVADTRQVQPNTSFDVVINCPTGKHVVAGGVETPSHRIIESGPVDGADVDTLPDDGWRIVAQNTLTTTKDLTSFATCVTATSIGAS